MANAERQGRRMYKSTSLLFCILLLCGCAPQVVVQNELGNSRYAAGSYGEALGIAFQLQDDYLGIWGDVELMGKAPNDLQQGKITFPVVLALEQDPRNLLLFTRDAHVGARAGVMLHELDRLGIRERVQTAIQIKAREVEERSRWLLLDGVPNLLSSLPTLLTNRSA